MFTLNQVFILLGLFCLVTLLATAWITALIVIRQQETEANRRIEDYAYQVEGSIEEANSYYRNEKARRQIAETAHQEALLKILRAGEAFGSEFSVEHSADWATGSDRKTDTFNNVLEFLNCIDDCRKQGRTVWYTRIGSLVLSN